MRFVINQSTVSRTLNTWMAGQLEQLIQCPQTTIGPSEGPYIHLPNTVGIIDGTEIFIERPSNLTQKASWSDYKSHNRAKYLVCIDPFTGVFMFASPAFSGNASDRCVYHGAQWISGQIEVQSTYTGKQRIHCSDLLARKQVFLTIPSFLRSTGKLSGEEAVQMRKIASVRIRVENAIIRLKDYKIFEIHNPTE